MIPPLQLKEISRRIHGPQKSSDEVVLYFKAWDSVFIFRIRRVVLGIVNWFKVVFFFDAFFLVGSVVLGYFVTWR